MCNVAVGEDDLVDRFAPTHVPEIGLVDDGNTVRVAAASKLARIAPTADAGDLGRGERYDLESWVITIHHVEVMEVAPCGTHDDDSCRCFTVRHVLALRGTGRMTLSIFGLAPRVTTTPQASFSCFSR